MTTTAVPFAPAAEPAASIDPRPVPEGSVGFVSPEFLHFSEPLTLSSGQVLPSYTLAVETYGQLNAARSNAVLVCHALNASHHVAGMDAERPDQIGWWENIGRPCRHHTLEVGAAEHRNLQIASDPDIMVRIR